MIMLKTLLAAVTFLLLSGPLNAHASIIYDWTGTCTVFCVGTATLHVVTTPDYVPGTTAVFGIGEPRLITAVYTDNVVTGDFGAVWQTNGQGFTLPATDGPGAATILVFEDEFRSRADGTWDLRSEGLFQGHGVGCPQPNFTFCTYTAIGNGGTWTISTTPEPSSGFLLLAACVVTWCLRRPLRKTASSMMLVSRTL